MIATLPYNHIFGPVHRVSFHCEEGIWQLMVLVTSICCEAIGGHKLKVWVTVSHGTTQWARWQAHTGDPTNEENLPVPPPPDHNFARSDLGLTQATLPEGLLGDGKNGLESWQDNIPYPRLINREGRKWAILPCASQAGYKAWLLKFAMGQCVTRTYMIQ